jgi:alkylation response protein AidB-like acyl-CoA dehydrogenase
MRFELSDDQRELQQIVRGFVEHHGTMAAVRGAAEHGDGFAAAIWDRLIGEMELTGLAVSSDHGGAGASFVEVGVALEELGRTLVPVPFLPTVVAAHALAEHVLPEAAGPLLQRIAGGAIATVALHGSSVTAGDDPSGPTLQGEVDHVLDGAHAELLVVAAESSDGPALYAVELSSPGVEVEAKATLDQTRRQAGVRLTAAPVTRLTAPGDGMRAIDRARDVLSVAYACEAVGGAARCLDLTITYLGERVQFGRPIGSFQALKHRCADLFVALESARSTAAYASWVVDAAPEELSIVAPLAQLVCCEALAEIARESIQLHGGIGFTWEHDAQLYLKRAKTTELLSGGQRRLRRLVGERAGII